MRKDDIYFQFPVLPFVLCCCGGLAAITDAIETKLGAVCYQLLSLAIMVFVVAVHVWGAMVVFGMLFYY